jgi:oxalate---CoA ligase
MFLELNTGSLTEPLSGRSWDPEQVAQEVERRVARYASLGLRRGDRVFILFGNRLEFFPELLAIWRLGACAVPVDSRLTPFEIETLSRSAAPRFGVVDSDTDEGLSSALAKVADEVILTREHPDAVQTTGNSKAQLDDDALILFTSGSTGKPKGVVHTHRSLRARWTTLGQSLGVHRYRRTLSLLPTHFGHGLICNCLFPWLSGQDLFVLPPFKPEIATGLGKMIDDHRITFMSSVPPVWRLALKLAKQPAGGTLERVHIGSAPLSAHLWNDVRRWCGTKEVFNAYGITETGSWVAGTTIPDFEPADGLVGEGWGSVVKVLNHRDPEGPLTPHAEPPAGEPGFVWLNTPALMKGYLNRDDLTNEVVAGGWFMTGDIGLLDDRGHLYLKGREREEINKGGMKIYPADVDAVVERFSGASDVCTFGYDDALYGQNIGMAVVLKDSAPEQIRSLRGWMVEHLAEHKMPLRWYLLDEIPRTSRGKINRENVMKQCTEKEPLPLNEILKGAAE